MLIGTPAYGGLVRYEYLQSVLGMRDFWDSIQVRNDVLINANDSLINRARNNLASQFLETDGYEELFFLDADCEISPNDAERLRQMTGIRGALVPLKGKDRWNAFKDGEMVTPETNSKPFSVDFLGTAALVLPKRVLSSMALSGRLNRYRDPIVGDVWEFFPTYVKDGTLLSEDYGFCELARECGHTITVNPAVSVKHYGVTAWG